MEVYENHLGGVFFSEEILEYEDLYCETCGDSDWPLGHADTWEEVLELLSDENGPVYTEEYLAELKKEFMEAIS